MIEFLRSVSIFSSLSPAELERVSRTMEKKTYPAGVIIFAENAPAEDFYVILSGRVEIVKRLGHNKEITLALLGSGYFFGEMAALEESVRSASVRTLETTQVLELSHKEFIALIQSIPMLTYALLRELSARLRDSDAKMISDSARMGEQLHQAYLNTVTIVANAIEAKDSYTGGHIDRVVGATIVAYWGAPLPNERHALDGCRCALRLKDKLATRVAPWKEKLGSEVVARISVCTGEMVVGNLSGARGRQRFAVFGPVMEAAERLVEQTVQLSTSLLIGEATFEAVKDEVGARELDLVRLPGRAYPLRLFELRSLKADQAEDDRAFCERFEQAVAAYRRREFNAALATFEALGKERPSDGPVALYVLRCKSYLAEPPGPEWDGVWEGASRH